jgi:hypothetical protein
MSWMSDLRCISDTSECYEQVKDEREVLALRTPTPRTMLFRNILSTRILFPPPLSRRDHSILEISNRTHEVEFHFLYLCSSVDFFE